jgi:hypothetical protein
MWKAELVKVMYNRFQFDCWWSWYVSVITWRGLMVSSTSGGREVN